jgi:hypothetical protein
MQLGSQKCGIRCIDVTLISEEVPSVDDILAVTHSIAASTIGNLVP